jgi:hypothetical protein
VEEKLSGLDFDAVDVLHVYLPFREERVGHSTRSVACPCSSCACEGPGVRPANCTVPHREVTPPSRPRRLSDHLAAAAAGRREEKGHGDPSSRR